MSPTKNDETTRALNGLLGAVLGGHPDVQNHMNQTGKSLDEVLGQLSSQQPSQATRSGGDLSGILGSLLDGVMSSQPQATPKPSRPKPGGKPSRPKPGKPTRPKPSATAPDSDAMGGILGALLGGGGSGGTSSSASSDPIGNLLGGLLGGGGTGGSAMGSNSFLAPISNAIADKFGIDRQIAQIVVSFALAKLLQSQTGSRNMDVSGLVNQMGSGKGVDQNYLNSTGLAQELASQSGLDQDTAAKSLAQVLNAFGKEMR